MPQLKGMMINVFYAGIPNTSCWITRTHLSWTGEKLKKMKIYWQPRMYPVWKIYPSGKYMTSKLVILAHKLKMLAKRKVLPTNLLPINRLCETAENSRWFDDEHMPDVVILILTGVRPVFFSGVKGWETTWVGRKQMSRWLPGILGWK